MSGLSTGQWPNETKIHSVSIKNRVSALITGQLPNEHKIHWII